MRILLFTQYYTPEPPLRPCELGTSLAQRGHDVVAITGSPSYPQGKIYKGYRALDLRWERIDGVRVLRLPCFPDHSQSAWRRIAYYASIATGATFSAPFVAGGFDAAFVFTPPMTLGVPAVLSKWLRGVPFVYDIQDVYPESLVATGLVSNQAVLNAMGWLDRFNCRHASAVTVISPGFKRNLIKKGVDEGKIHVIPNWADESIYKPVARSESLAQALGLAGRFNVMYGGNMGIPQVLTNVLDAAERVQDLEEVQFVFVGDGVKRPELEEMATRKGLRNVRFLGRKTAQEMPAIYALSDVLLIHLKRDLLFAITIPGKTIAYLAAGKPILVSVEGDAADVILSAGAGLACPPEDPGALADGVRRLYGLSPEERERMGRNGRQSFLTHYTREFLVGKFEQLFHSISRRNT